MSNAQRQPAIPDGRRAPHPGEALTAERPTAPTRPSTAPRPAVEPVRDPEPADNPKSDPLVQYNVNVRQSTKDRVERAVRKLSYETNTTVTKGGLTDEALDAWLTSKGL